jgi:hypothetical protein
MKLHMLVPESKIEELIDAVNHHTGKNHFPKRRPPAQSAKTETYETTLDAGSMHHRPPNKSKQAPPPQPQQPD